MNTSTLVSVVLDKGKGKKKPNNLQKLFGTKDKSNEITPMQRLCGVKKK